MVDIEALLIDYLSSILPIPVAADVPEDKPARFVSLERTGGGSRQLVVDRPIVAIQCWADSRADAELLAAMVDKSIKFMPDEYPDVVDASRNSAYNFPDPSSRKSRYQIVYDFICQE